MWVYEVEEGGLGEGVGQQLVGYEAVDFQHGFRVEQGSHLALLPAPQVRDFFVFENPACKH